VCCSFHKPHTNLGTTLHRVASMQELRVLQRYVGIRKGNQNWSLAGERWSADYNSMCGGVLCTGDLVALAV
jgi:hypothetical protein